MTTADRSSVSSEAAAELRRLLLGVRIAPAISVFAAMGVPDALGDEPRDANDLARELGADGPTLYRLLRMLAAAGLLREDDARRFVLTDVGAALRSDADGSLREQAILFGRPELLAAWGNLEHSIRTGENAFAALNGEDVWTWRARRPEAQSQFNRTMAVLSAPVGPALAASMDLAEGARIVDIGGGNGTLIAAILARHRDARGIVFDQPGVVEEAAPVLEAAGIADRVETVGGSFFDAVPAADVYVMKSILHDWSDSDSIAILRTIRAGGGADARLVVVERILGAPNEDLEGKVSDLHMLVMPGGQERTLEEWRALLASGGWDLHSARPLVAGYQMIEAGPASS